MVLKGRSSYQDLMIQDVSRFTRCDTLLQRAVSASGRITAPTVKIQAGSELSLLLDGLNPIAGQSFQLFSGFSSLTGTFAAVHLPEFETGLGWDTTNLYSTGTVQVFAYLAGDADKNRSVAFADYQLLEANFGAAAGATWAMGDFNGDHAVTFTDYQMLEANFGKSIPEPATLCLLLSGGLALVCRRKAAG